MASKDRNKVERIHVNRLWVAVWVLALAILFLLLQAVSNDHRHVERGPLEQSFLKFGEGVRHTGELDLTDLGWPYWDYVHFVHGYLASESLHTNVINVDSLNLDMIPYVAEGKDMLVAIFYQGDVICFAEAIPRPEIPFFSFKNDDARVYDQLIPRDQASLIVTPPADGTNELSRYHLRWKAQDPKTGIVPGGLMITDTQKLPHNPTGVCGPDYETAKKNGG